jgi:hypothetical protein
LVTAGLVVVVGAAFPAVAAGQVGADVAWTTVRESALRSLLPALGLLATVRLAGTNRLASWASLVGALLTLALGTALYAAALGPDARPSARLLAVGVVPFRQVAAVAVVAWAVWIARRAR